MVLCATCRVSTIDRHCFNTPRSCYQCCTSHADILTCPFHYHQMGISDAAARLASGRVHANIVEDAEAGLPSAPPPAPPGSESAAPSSASLAPPGPDPPAAPVPVIAAPAPPAVMPSSLTLSSVAATVVDLAASVVGVAASLAEMRVSLAAMSAATRPQATPAATAPVPAARPAEPPRTSPVPSPPHQAAVLDRAAAATRSEVAQLVNRFSALANDDDSDDEIQVRQQPHTRGAQPSAAALLPAAFIPTPSGTAQSAQQQLAAIINGLSKQSSKVKYATIAELDEALDDWATDAAKSGTRTTAQVEAIRAYQRLLVVRFSVSEQRPLKDVLEYHRRWCKAVHAGTIDMFAPGAALNHDILYEVTHPLHLGAASAHSAAKSGKSKDAGTAAKTGTTGRPPAVAKHPAGSCINHPTSTSHTTAECNKK